MDSNLKIDVDDLEELKIMPECAEKLLISLMNDLSNVDDNHVLLDGMVKLKDRIDLEGLNSFDVDQLFKNVKKTALNRNDIETAFSSLKEIHLKIRDLNIPKFLRLTKENNEALDDVFKNMKKEDKNIYLFIGLTGSCKSTSLHFLGGTKLYLGEVNDRTDIIPQKPISNPYLERVKIGSSIIDSETLNIIPIVVPTENIDEADGKTTIFCDIFNDTRGSEIDISNGVAISKCVESCNGIKPVIIISNQLGDKLQLLNELSDVLNSMFLKFESEIYNFVYINTKYKDEKIIKETLKSVENSLNERIDKKEQVTKPFEILIKDMKKKASSSVILIDPINGDREETLNI